MIISQPNAVYWDKPAQLEDWLRELEANLERLAERLNRIEDDLETRGEFRCN